jgi:hypothetical protein
VRPRSPSRCNSFSSPMITKSLSRVRRLCLCSTQAILPPLLSISIAALHRRTKHSLNSSVLPSLCDISTLSTMLSVRTQQDPCLRGARRQKQGGNSKNPSRSARAHSGQQMRRQRGSGLQTVQTCGIFLISNSFHTLVPTRSSTSPARRRPLPPAVLRHQYVHHLIAPSGS